MARQCFYINPTQKMDPRGYIPSLVIEDEPGHAPLVGNGDFAVPWFWGKTLEAAEAQCRTENERLGLSREDVFQIVLSSMRAGMRSKGVVH